MAEALTTATVHLVLPDGDEVVAGTVSSEGPSGSSSAPLIFRYSDSYITDGRGYELSPDMPLTGGPLRTWSGRESLGALGDTMPDDWGRRIIRAGTHAHAPLDFLLHVNDVTRQGALRVSDGKGTYLANTGHPVAMVQDLDRIIAAARSFEDGTESDDELHILVEAGTSAGGARPKAIVRHNGDLWIAKFARQTEFNDPMAWEATALALARKAGIQTPDFELLRLNEERSVLATRRFDRDGDRRLGYISAHSLTTKLDSDASSYSHLADTLAQVSADPRRDLVALFRRAALNLLIGNVDDHFRNHGFIRRVGGWELSPVFDLEPNRRPNQVGATPITDSGEQYGRDIRELQEAHDMFRLSRNDASTIIRDVAERTADWHETALGYGISSEAATAMSQAFEGANREQALGMQPADGTGSGSASRKGPAQSRRGQLGIPGNPGQWASSRREEEIQL